MESITVNGETINKGTYILFVYPELADCHINYFLIPFDLEQELCKLLLSINGLIVNVNYNKYDHDHVEWFCDFTNSFHYFKKLSDDEKRKPQNTPILNYYMTDNHIGDKTISYVSTAYFPD